MNLEVVVLAAGHGSRMKSETPKVLHTVGGRPMLERVLDAVAELEPKRIHVVVGSDANEIQQSLSAVDVNWVVQESQLGTGHAVLQTVPHLATLTQVLIAYGDCPLITSASLKGCLIDSEVGLRLLSARVPDPAGFGRIVRDERDQVTAIVEQSDLSGQQNQIDEINSGILCTSSEVLKDLLPRLSSENAQNEYYLTDIVALAIENGLSVSAIEVDDYTETLGVNDRSQLATVERLYQRRQAEQLMQSGLTISDPKRFDLRGTMQVGTDCYIDINGVFEGTIELGNNVSVGPNCILRNVSIASNTQIRENTVIEDATVGQNCSIGPFSRIRPGTTIDEGVHIGNFVEVKNSQIHAGVKAAHLAYLGDAEVGSETNIGAGAITCNFDGTTKNHTFIGDGVFIGTNCSLIAPLTIESGAFVAAGSTIGKSVAAGAFAIERSEQRIVPEAASRMRKQ